jgi:hypothetical protein
MKNASCTFKNKDTLTKQRKREQHTSEKTNQTKKNAKNEVV